MFLPFRLLRTREDESETNMPALEKEVKTVKIKTEVGESYVQDL